MINSSENTVGNINSSSLIDVCYNMTEYGCHVCFQDINFINCTYYNHTQDYFNPVVQALDFNSCLMHCCQYSQIGIATIKQLDLSLYQCSANHLPPTAFSTFIVLILLTLSCFGYSISRCIYEQSTSRIKNALNETTLDVIFMIPFLNGFELAAFVYILVNVFRKPPPDPKESIQNEVPENKTKDKESRARNLMYEVEEVPENKQVVQNSILLVYSSDQSSQQGYQKKNSFMNASKKQEQLQLQNNNSSKCMNSKIDYEESSFSPKKSKSIPKRRKYSSQLLRKKKLAKQTDKKVHFHPEIQESYVHLQEKCSPIVSSSVAESVCVSSCQRLCSCQNKGFKKILIPSKNRKNDFDEMQHFYCIEILNFIFFNGQQKSLYPDSNRRPLAYQASALPTKLHRLVHQFISNLVLEFFLFENQI